jgi:hypothetical protein
LILRAETGDRFSQEDVIKELLDTVPVPVRR